MGRMVTVQADCQHRRFKRAGPRFRCIDCGKFVDKSCQSRAFRMVDGRQQCIGCGRFWDGGSCG